MRIAILGAGAIGSTFAYHLARAGHQVTVVARGARFEWLSREGAIVLGDGQRASVEVASALDESVPWDLTLVTVLATQVDAVLPALCASASRTVMFMFNTFDAIDPLRDAVGPQRFVFGFPGGVFTRIIDGRAHAQVRSGTTVGEAKWAELFSAAGIPSVVDQDMQSWLRSHAAMVAPLMTAGTIAYARGAGVTWSEAKGLAVAMQTGKAIVRAVGSDVRPSIVSTLLALPLFMLTPLLWAFSRTKMLYELGSLGTAEPRMLIDMMERAAPQLAEPLRAIRPK